MLTRDEQLGQIVGLEPCKVLQEAGEEGRPPEDLRAREASGAELTDAGIARGLAQLLAARFPNQGMVREHGRLSPPEQPAQSDLTACGLEQIFPPNDEIHTLAQVVH